MKLTCSCGNNCERAEMGFPSGTKLQVPMCLMIEGIFKDRKVMENLRHFDIHVLTEAKEKATRDLDDGKKFWDRVEKNLNS